MHECTYHYTVGKHSEDVMFCISYKLLAVYVGVAGCFAVIDSESLFLFRNNNELLNTFYRPGASNGAGYNVLKGSIIMN